MKGYWGRANVWSDRMAICQLSSLLLALCVCACVRACVRVCERALHGVPAFPSVL